MKRGKAAVPWGESTSYLTSPSPGVTLTDAIVTDEIKIN
ncbi:hypothetical protein XBFM1_1580016 [Xenorhabdus bovienii str. feltiae Moldova]|uniref:Uncharacterized protein n=1 Tax=Xenorhabdus bovienii str. feltiae Moldova TaxID=1398200 RepID=A0A077NP97_XENBV|nr:hypothetical protein XBFM1_1580016 [Xenorhabdus bovienii str. feltiae Moldova]